MKAAPFLTASIPGCGGRLRARPDHFIVEEIPLREPLGHGDYLRIFVEKKRMSTPELVRRLAYRLKVERSQIGVAGNKDSDAITRQWISVPAGREARLRDHGIDDVSILDGDLDPEPLTTGDLAGNQFAIAVSELDDVETAQRNAEAVLAELVRRGVPNFFGPQRFGTRGIAADIGGALLRGDYEPAIDLLLGGAPHVESDRAALDFRALVANGDLAAARRVIPRSLGLERSLLDALFNDVPKASLWKRIPHPDRRMFLSAWQSRIFNRIVARRLDSIDTPIAGDILLDHGTNGLRTTDPERDLATVRAFGASPTGWMPGASVPRATLEMGAIEREAFESDPVPERRFVRPLDLTLPGERRPLRVRLGDPHLSTDPERGWLLVEFGLPKGAFATTVLAEIRKADAPPI